MSTTDPNAPASRSGAPDPATANPSPRLPRELIARVQAWTDQHACGSEPRETDVPGLSILRRREPTALDSMLYTPSLCLILQGEKEVHAGARRVCVAAGHCVVVSHHLPIVARVTVADAARPFLAMVIDLDLSIVRSLCDAVGEDAARDEIAEHPASALDTASHDPLLVDAMARLFEVLDRPVEIPVMAPLILREVHYRLLSTRQGSLLRQRVRRRSHASRIAQAIAWIRERFAEPIVVREVARVAGMSPSTFHEHFKAFTATTPLQYQKDIRLLAARELLRDGVHSVSGTAFEVGYESASHFSRDYARKFGRSPSQDLAGRRA